MRCLVTGANGFVGRAICAGLFGQGFKVRAATRQAHTELVQYEQVIITDINGQTQWSAALQNVDVVIHLAARVHVIQETATDPLADFLEVNLHGTENLALQAAKAGVKRFIYFSSVKVHGEVTPPRLSWTETDTPMPQDAYGISKWQAEQALHKIAQHTGLELVIIRPPLVYGPGVRANFAALLRAVRQGWPLPVASINNRRSLVALDNLVDFTLLCVRHAQAANQTFLISDGHDLSTCDLVRGLARAAGVPTRLLPVPLWVLKTGAALLGKGAAMQRLCGNLQIDISKAHHLLGWKPVIDVDEGLRRVVTNV